MLNRDRVDELGCSTVLFYFYFNSYFQFHRALSNSPVLPHFVLYWGCCVPVFNFPEPKARAQFLGSRAVSSFSLSRCTWNGESGRGLLSIYYLPWGKWERSREIGKGLDGGRKEAVLRVDLSLDRKGGTPPEVCALLLFPALWQLRSPLSIPCEGPLPPCLCTACEGRVPAAERRSKAAGPIVYE